MQLIGMFDSPFVRRVAVSLKLLGLPFEHRNWSVGRDQAQIRHYNPLGRVPTLVLDDGEALADSAAILDYLDQRVGPARALLPGQGRSRREALQLMALAGGAAEKGVAQIYERIFRPAERQDEAWVQRCAEQTHGALALLDRHCTARDGWLVDARLTQADITVATACSFLHDSLDLAPTLYPALLAHAARCEALPAFVETRVPFFRPQPAP